MPRGGRIAKAGGRSGRNAGEDRRRGRKLEDPGANRKRLGAVRTAPAQMDGRGTAEATSPRANLVHGRHPVLEALKAGRPINKILVSDASEGGSLLEILGKARAAGVVVQTVPKAHLQKVAGENHQGVVAFVAPRDYVELDDLVARDTGQQPLILLLDEVSDPYNFGAILRTAEAVGAQGVVIPKRRAVPLTETVAKAAAGAVEYVPVARVSNLVQAIERLQSAGYWVVGADVAGESLYTDVDYRGAIAVVIGAEGKGLSRLVKERCDYLVKLPMHGKLQSLNASVAAGVLLYEVVRQRG
ncbi:23S rRNA (guanosine(2251)-2'-O)-methyltransferase RlmB [Alicyclobacillus contaminans]|uniref:23S rRNA (guanosine(2251)-2'-O)-methyltransferase RlmB n=1 Tax=Alicyclobacillus contaminans TaxID=392016 RepID=UPI00040A0FFE